MNFGYPNTGCSGVASPGLHTGFFFIPTVGNGSIARAIRFATAGDSPTRDPITMTLEGSNYTTISSLNLGTSWTLIYSGSTGISSSTDPGRQVYGTQENLPNTEEFISYRILFTSKRGTDNSVQFSEFELMGYV